jgi:hypothetical protein
MEIRVLKIILEPHKVPLWHTGEMKIDQALIKNKDIIIFNVFPHSFKDKSPHQILLTFE